MSTRSRTHTNQLCPSTGWSTSKIKNTSEGVAETSTVSTPVFSIGALLKRVQCLEKAWEEHKIESLLMNHYDPQQITEGADSVTVAVIGALSNGGQKREVGEDPRIAVVKALAERGITPSVPVEFAAEQQQPSSKSAPHHHAHSNAYSFLPHSAAPSLSRPLYHEGGRGRTMSDVCGRPTESFASSSSSSCIGVPQVDLDELLNPTKTATSDISASSKQDSCSPTLHKQDLLGKLRQRFLNVLDTSGKRQRSLSDVGHSRSSGLHEDYRPNWMKEPKYLQTLLPQLKSPCQCYVEWNILGLQKALGQQHFVRLVSPLFNLQETNLSAHGLQASSMLLMLQFHSHGSCPSHVSVSLSLPEEVDVQYRVFHSSYYLSDSRAHSFSQTPWTMGDLIPLPTPIPEVFTVGAVIEDIFRGGEDQHPRTPANSMGVSHSGATTATIHKNQPPRSLDSLPSLSEFIDLGKPGDESSPPSGGNYLTTPSPMLISSPSLETMLQTFSTAPGDNVSNFTCAPRSSCSPASFRNEAKLLDIIRHEFMNPLASDEAKPSRRSPRYEGKHSAPSSPAAYECPAVYESSPVSATALE